MGNRFTASLDSLPGRPTGAAGKIDNSLLKVSLRLFGTTLYATGFSIIVLVYMGFLINEGVWGAIVHQLFTLVVYTPIIYLAAWKDGDRDRNHVQFGHMEADRLRGLKIGLVAIVPYAFCLLVMLLSKIGILPDPIWLGLVRFVYAPYIVLFNLLVPNMLTSDIPATVADASYWGILGASLLQLYVPAVAAIAYRLGYKGVSLYHKMIYKAPDKSKKA